MKFKDIFNIFKKDEAPREKRSLVSAFSSNSVDFSRDYLTPINADILQGLLESVRKCRGLALNSPFARSWLAISEKNVIGKSGIALQCQVKSSETELNSKLNDSIEWAWYDFGKKSNGYLTVDGQMRPQ